VDSSKSAVPTDPNNLVRVLIAEDDRLNQRIMKHQMKDFDITSAYDGVQCVELFKNSMEQDKPFDIVFMDNQMPKMNGVECTRKLRELSSTIPIIAISADRHWQNTGITDHLPKPFKKEDLLAIVHRYLPKRYEYPQKSNSIPENSV